MAKKKKTAPAEPPLREVLSGDIRLRMVAELAAAADDTELKAPGLRRSTIGCAYVDRVFFRLCRVARESGEEFKADTKGRPTLYRIGDLRIAHYSVRIQSGGFVTNVGKRMVTAYVNRRDQGVLFPDDERWGSRLDGPLAIIATNLVVTSSEEAATILLAHAFIGYPGTIATNGSINSWSGESLVLTRPELTTTAAPESTPGIENIQFRDEMRPGDVEAAGDDPDGGPKSA